MRYITSRPLELWFAKIDVAEKYDRPCLVTAGDGEEPDFSKLTLTDYAKKEEWRASIQALVATAARVRVPYVEPDPNAPTVPRVDDVPPLVVETNPVIPIAVGTSVVEEKSSAPASAPAPETNDIGAL